MLRDLIIAELRRIADKIEAGNCELSDSQAMDILSVISHEVLSKDDACRYMNISRSRFDDLVRQGKIPKGKKRRGFKELVFYKDELDQCIYRYGRNK